MTAYLHRQSRMTARPSKGVLPRAPLACGTGARPRYESPDGCRRGGPPPRSAAGRRRGRATVHGVHGGKGRDVSNKYGGMDETCPLCTGGRGGGVGGRGTTWGPGGRLARRTRARSPQRRARPRAGTCRAPTWPRCQARWTRGRRGPPGVRRASTLRTRRRMRRRPSKRYAWSP